MSVFSHLFWPLWSALDTTKLQLFWWIHLYSCFFSFANNYRIYTATIYVIKSSENLPFLSILFYVIRTRFDKVTVFSFWYSFHSVQNSCKQFHRAHSEVVCTYWRFPTPPKVGSWPTVSSNSASYIQKRLGQMNTFWQGHTFVTQDLVKFHWFTLCSVQSQRQHN